MIIKFFEIEALNISNDISIKPVHYVRTSPKPKNVSKQLEFMFGLL